MKFKLEISELGNAAFEDNFQAELAWQIRKVSNKIELGYTTGIVRDSNGNAVGIFDLGETDE